MHKCITFLFALVVYFAKYILASPYEVHPGQTKRLDPSNSGFGTDQNFLFLSNNFVTPHIAQHQKSLKNVDVALVHLSRTLLRGSQVQLQG